MAVPATYLILASKAFDKYFADKVEKFLGL